MPIRVRLGCQPPKGALHLGKGRARREPERLESPNLLDR
jgi:hypothetical protein